jgi:hypothetical protein
MLQKLMKVDEMIDRHGIRNIYRRTKGQVIRNVVAFVVTAVVTHFMGCVAQCDWTFLSIAHISVENFVITFIIFITLLFADLTRALKCRYKYIIDDLEEHFRVKDTVISISSETSSRSYLSNMPYSKNRTFSWTTRPVSLNVMSDSYRIRVLRNVYVQLYDCVALLNSYFGIPVLFVILTVMVTGVSALYSGVYFLRSGDDDIGTDILACFLILLGVLFLTTFAWLVTCCHATSAEADRGAVSIHRITACINVERETSVELDRLSNQLDKMNVQFTACGFFSLKLPLLCTLIGGILTYILVAVQMS